MRIGKRHCPAEGKFKVSWARASRIRLLLQSQLVQQHLIEDQLANLAIDLPNALVERWNLVLMFCEHGIGRFRQVLSQFVVTSSGQIFAAMLFKETPQNIVQKFSGVDRLQIERSFRWWFKSHYSAREKSKRAVAVAAQTARSVNVLRSEMTSQHLAQISIADLAVIRSKPLTVSLALDSYALPRRRGNIALRFRPLQQLLRRCWRKSGDVRWPRRLLALPDQGHRQLTSPGSVEHIMRVNVAANLLDLELRRRNRAAQFFDIIRRDGFAAVVQGQRSRQIQSISCSTSGLVKIVLLFQQRIGRDVFEEDALLLQAHALLVRIEPVAGSSQRKATFDHPGNEDCPKAQPADIGGLEHAQTIPISNIQRQHLRAQGPLNFSDEMSQQLALVRGGLRLSGPR